MDERPLEPKLTRKNPIFGSFLLLWKDKLAFASFLYLIALFITSALSPMIVGDKLTKVDFESFMFHPSIRGGHIFGTDALGRDLFLNILIASRSSLMISIIVVGASTIIGTFTGMLAGYYGGILDDLVIHLIDLMMAFPSLLLVLVVIFIAGTGTDKVILVLIVTGWTGYARIARAETLRLREFQYVEVAKCLGGSDFRIIIRHILPNLVNVIIVMAVLGIVGVIMTESGLSFLGMGIQPPDVSWGLLVAQGRNYLTNSWWLAFFPGLAIFITTTAFSLLSDWVGVIVDPVHRMQLLDLVRQKPSVKIRTSRQKG
ncbi:MAG: ABC transporter permease [Anaerolineaceae bacterium]|nr:MAG: ABC transporter permease [Anaerolineaceae bacterium]